MVTPYKASAISIVGLLWVMMMNCVRADSSRSTLANRMVFSSSSGASI